MEAECGGRGYHLPPNLCAYRLVSGAREECEEKWSEVVGVMVFVSECRFVHGWEERGRLSSLALYSQKCTVCHTPDARHFMPFA